MVEGVDGVEFFDRAEVSAVEAEEGLPDAERLRPSSLSDSICFFCRKS